MPGLNGYEVCRRLLARPETKNTRVIFLTSKGRVDLPESPDLVRAMQQNVEERAKGFDAGAIRFISKPVSAKEVVEELRRVLAIGQFWHLT